MIDKAAVIKSAQKFLSKGQIDKAIAEWQKIASAYRDGNSYNSLGDLYLKKGDKKSAIEEYNRAAKVYMNEGFSLKALALFKKILNLDPQNTFALISLGNLNEEKNIYTDAIKYYLAAADALSKKKKRDELLEVYERILNLAPKNIQLKIKVAELFSKEGFIPQAAQEYCNIGKLFLEKGEADKAKSFLTKSAEIMPNNKDALLVLSEMAERSGNLDQASTYLKSAAEKTGDDADVLMRNAQVLVTKGSHAEAAALLSKVIAGDPGNVKARILMGGIHEKAGQKDKAWQEYSAVMDSLVSGDNPEAAVKILEAYKDIDPVENRKRLVALHQRTGNDSGAFNDLYGLYDLYLQKGMKVEAIECLQQALEIQPENMDALANLANLKKEDAPAAGKAEAESPAAQAPPPPVSQDAVPPQDMSPRETTAPPEPSPATPRKDAGPDLSEAISEVDFYLQQGFYQEAANTLRKLVAKYPDNRDLKARLEETENRLYAGQPSEEVPGSNGDTPETFEDLSIAELEEFAVPESHDISLDSDVREIFDEFKKGLANEIEAEDAETHYNLGIAYKEMGLVDDAIKEFQTAQHDPGFFNQASTMIGICYMQSGQYPLAIDSFSAALMKTDPSDETAWSIKYDLALAYEQKGDVQEAYRILSEVQKWNAGFREVAAKVGQLKAAAGAGGAAVEGSATAQAAPAAAAAKDKRGSRVSYI